MLVVAYFEDNLGQENPLTAHDFQLKFNCKYTDDIYSSTGDSLRQIFTQKNFFKDVSIIGAQRGSETEKSAKNNLMRIWHRMENPLNESFIIYDTGRTGYSLKLRKSAEPIQPGTLLGLYAGRQMTLAEQFHESFKSADQKDAYLQGNAFVTPREEGNLMRMIQHAPNCKSQSAKSIEECFKKVTTKSGAEIITRSFGLENLDWLEKTTLTRQKSLFLSELTTKNRALTFDGDAEDARAIKIFEGVNKNSIASANTLFINLNISYKNKSYPISYVVAIQKIDKGNMVAISYGKNYFSSRGINYLFYEKNGAPLDNMSDEELCNIKCSFPKDTFPI